VIVLRQAAQMADQDRLRRLTDHEGQRLQQIA
jgi:hypothetical protein